MNQFQSPMGDPEPEGNPSGVPIFRQNPPAMMHPPQVPVMMYPPHTTPYPVPPPVPYPAVNSGAPMHPGGYFVPAVPAQSPVHTDGLAIASMIVGIMALPLAFFGIVGLIAGCTAVTFAHVSRTSAKLLRRVGSGYSTAGLMFGYWALVMFVVINIEVISLALKSR